MSKPYVITTGDSDGIGYEVTCKALSRLKVSKSLGILLVRSRKSQNLLFDKNLRKKFRLVQVDSTTMSMIETKKIFAEKSSRPILVEYISPEPAPFWVVEAADSCLKGIFNGLITGPLSKPLINKCGLNAMGHTGILKKICGIKDVYMTFLGTNFNVALATDHIPLQNVQDNLNLPTYKEIIVKLSQLKKRIAQVHNKKILKLPIGVIGLNPHAGDHGVIGQFDGKFFKSLQGWANKAKISIDCPLVPDAAFLSFNQQKYSFFISAYHDQGLIPFKLVHNHAGTQYSLGLPFTRTSVDHGTAKDILALARPMNSLCLKVLNGVLNLVLKYRRFELCLIQ